MEDVDPDDGGDLDKLERKESRSSYQSNWTSDHSESSEDSFTDTDAFSPETYPDIDTSLPYEEAIDTSLAQPSEEVKDDAGPSLSLGRRTMMEGLSDSPGDVRYISKSLDTLDQKSRTVESDRIIHSGDFIDRRHSVVGGSTPSGSRPPNTRIHPSEGSLVSASSDASVWTEDNDASINSLTSSLGSSSSTAAMIRQAQRFRRPPRIPVRRGTLDPLSETLIERSAKRSLPSLAESGRQSPVKSSMEMLIRRSRETLRSPSRDRGSNDQLASPELVVTPQSESTGVESAMTEEGPNLSEIDDGFAEDTISDSGTMAGSKRRDGVSPAGNEEVSPSSNGPSPRLFTRLKAFGGKLHREEKKDARSSSYGLPRATSSTSDSPVHKTSTMLTDSTTDSTSTVSTSMTNSSSFSGSTKKKGILGKLKYRTKRSLEELKEKVIERSVSEAEHTIWNPEESSIRSGVAGMLTGITERVKAVAAAGGMSSNTDSATRTGFALQYVRVKAHHKEEKELSRLVMIQELGGAVVKSTLSSSLADLSPSTPFSSARSSPSHLKESEGKGEENHNSQTPTAPLTASPESMSPQGQRTASEGSSPSQPAALNRLTPDGKLPPELLQYVEIQKPIWAMKFSKDGRYLAVGGQDCILRVWAIIGVPHIFQADPQQSVPRDTEKRRPRPGSAPSKSGGGMNDEGYVKSGGSPGAARATKVSLHQMLGPIFKRSPYRIYADHSEPINDISWSTSNYIITASVDKSVRLYHITRQECLACFRHNDFVTGVVFHPLDERYFLSGSLDGRLRVWSVWDKKVKYWEELPPGMLITAVSLTTDGRMAVAGTSTGDLVFFEFEGLKYNTQINIKGGRSISKGERITGIEPMPRSQIPSAMMSGGLTVAVPVPQMTSPLIDAPLSLAADPEDMENNATPKRASVASTSSSISSNLPFSVGSPNSAEEMFLVTSNDSRVRLYHVRQKYMIKKFRGNENRETQLRASFSDDGRYIVCGSEDRSVYLWNTFGQNSLSPSHPPGIGQINQGSSTDMLMASSYSSGMLSGIRQWQTNSEYRSSAYERFSAVEVEASVTATVVAPRNVRRWLEIAGQREKILTTSGGQSLRPADGLIIVVGDDTGRIKIYENEYVAPPPATFTSPSVLTHGSSLHGALDAQQMSFGPSELNNQLPQLLKKRDPSERIAAGSNDAPNLQPDDILSISMSRSHLRSKSFGGTVIESSVTASSVPPAMKDDIGSNLNSLNAVAAARQRHRTQSAGLPFGSGVPKSSTGILQHLAVATSARQMKPVDPIAAPSSQARQQPLVNAAGPVVVSNGSNFPGNSTSNGVQKVHASTKLDLTGETYFAPRVVSQGEAAHLKALDEERIRKLEFEAAVAELQNPSVVVQSGSSEDMRSSGGSLDYQTADDGALTSKVEVGRAQSDTVKNSTMRRSLPLSYPTASRRPADTPSISQPGSDSTKPTPFEPERGRKVSRTPSLAMHAAMSSAVSFFSSASGSKAGQSASLHVPSADTGRRRRSASANVAYRPMYESNPEAEKSTQLSTSENRQPNEQQKPSILDQSNLKALSAVLAPGGPIRRAVSAMGVGSLMDSQTSQSVNPMGSRQNLASGDSSSNQGSSSAQSTPSLVADDSPDQWKTVGTTQPKGSRSQLFPPSHDSDRWNTGGEPMSLANSMGKSKSSSNLKTIAKSTSTAAYMGMKAAFRRRHVHKGMGENAAENVREVGDAEGDVDLDEEVTEKRTSVDDSNCARCGGDTFKMVKRDGVRRFECAACAFEKEFGP
ncbi:hypothetical protein BJ742DRAFT_787213 [Cladochytrium replicatum]|nr:hypothetical protein BJ742DRAFT_787213 [Cladochytrium replicatum]